jgi:outer membrane lipoprotein SlyB
MGGVMYWHPDTAIADNSDWRPYYDMGQWVLTDNGLFWRSDYSWGDIPFHYGRWVLDREKGWLWAPDYTWGPAWVFWRQAEEDAAIGWAPLPVGTDFVDGVFMFNGVWEGVGFDFGLGEACFTFVGYDHFHEDFVRSRGHEWPYHIARKIRHRIYGRSIIRNDFRQDEHGWFVNNGIGRDLIEQLTHVERSTFEERPPVVTREALEEARNHRNEQPGKRSEKVLVKSGDHDMKVLIEGTFVGALAGTASGGRHAGEHAVIGAALGTLSGALIGNMIDREQQRRLQQQSPQTWQTIQHNDAVVQQQQAAQGQTQGQAQGQAPPAEAVTPITVDDIKALTAAGVKTDAIKQEIEVSKSTFSAQDIALTQQANPPVDPAVIECMKSHAGPPVSNPGWKSQAAPAHINRVFRPPTPKSNQQQTPN